MPIQASIMQVMQVHASSSLVCTEAVLGSVLAVSWISSCPKCAVVGLKDEIPL